MTNIRVHPADHRDRAVAEGIHAVQKAAYTLEAELLGARRFPPLDRTVDDVQRGAERFIVATDNGAIIGAIGVEPGAAPGELLIGSLVVMPDRWREGIGRRLVQAVIDAHPTTPLTVSTGVKNAPGPALYAACGFVEYGREVRGEERIEVVLLKRAPTR